LRLIDEPRPTREAGALWRRAATTIFDLVSWWVFGLARNASLDPPDSVYPVCVSDRPLGPAQPVSPLVLIPTYLVPTFLILQRR
jgi:hypothetical protein